MRRVLLAAGLAAALALAPGAAAKYRITLTLTTEQPRVGQLVLVSLRTDVPADQAGTLRLVAVPPGMSIYAALRTEERHRLPLVRIGDRWAANIRFSRPGRWRLVVPNWGAPGYAIPPPVVRVVRVR